MLRGLVARAARCKCGAQGRDLPVIHARPGAARKRRLIEGNRSARGAWRRRGASATLAEWRDAHAKSGET
jgi:hypothetical protein